MVRNAALMWTLAMVSPAFGQVATVEYIGPGTIGGYHMNDAGQIVTDVWDGERLRVGVYTDGAPVRYVDPPGFSSTFGARIANSGQVAFTGVRPGEYWAMRHTEGQGAISLNAPGVIWAYAGGVNDHGEVALGVMDGGQYAAVWRDGAGVVPISSPSSSPGMTHVHGINNSGQIAGTWEDVRPVRAVRYTPGIGIEELGTLGGTSVSRAMNNNGDVIGWSRLSPGDQQWFVYTDAGGMRSLGVDVHEGVINSINDRGWIVGSLGSRSVLWTEETGFIDLTSLLPPGSQGILHDAQSVNNSGQIATYGHVGGVWGIYRVTVHEIPGPGTGAALLGLLAFGRRRRP